MIGEVCRDNGAPYLFPGRANPVKLACTVATRMRTQQVRVLRIARMVPSVGAHYQDQLASFRLFSLSLSLVSRTRHTQHEAKAEVVAS